MNRDELNMVSGVFWPRCVDCRCVANRGADVSLLEQSASEGESPFVSSADPCARRTLDESRSSELERKVGGKFHLMLIIGLRPIANKYHEGKMIRTLEREL